MQELRQNTIIEVKIGPCLDSTGMVPVTNLTIDAADEAEILKNGITATVSIAGTLTAITGCDGWYLLTLSASDTDTLGLGKIVIQDDSLCLPIWQDFQVVTPGYYDAKYASTGAIPVNVVQVSGNSVAADNLQAAYDGTGYAGGTILQKVNVDAIRTDTQSAVDLKDFADTGYNPATHLLVGGVTLSSATYTSADDFKATGFSTFDPAATGVTLANAAYTGINDFKADVSGTLKASLTGAVYTSINDFKATGFSTFDPATQGVTLGSAIYTSIDDFKANIASLNDITVADIIAGIVDGSYDLQEMLRLMFAALCCKVNGGSTTTITFRDSADSKNRIVATVDENGNRTAVTLDGS